MTELIKDLKFPKGEISIRDYCKTMLKAYYAASYGDKKNKERISERAVKFHEDYEKQMSKYAPGQKK